MFWATNVPAYVQSLEPNQHVGGDSTIPEVYELISNSCFKFCLWGQAWLALTKVGVCLGDHSEGSANCLCTYWWKAGNSLTWQRRVAKEGSCAFSMLGERQGCYLILLRLSEMVQKCESEQHGWVSTSELARRAATSSCKLPAPQTWCHSKQDPSLSSRGGKGYWRGLKLEKGHTWAHSWFPSCYWETMFTPMPALPSCFIFWRTEKAAGSSCFQYYFPLNWTAISHFTGNSRLLYRFGELVIPVSLLALQVFPSKAFWTKIAFPFHPERGRSLLSALAKAFLMNFRTTWNQSSEFLQPLPANLSLSCCWKISCLGSNKACIYRGVRENRKPSLEHASKSTSKCVNLNVAA